MSSHSSYTLRQAALCTWSGSHFLTSFSQCPLLLLAYARARGVPQVHPPCRRWAPPPSDPKVGGPSTEGGLSPLPAPKYLGLVVHNPQAISRHPEDRLHRLTAALWGSARGLQISWGPQVPKRESQALLLW